MSKMSELAPRIVELVEKYPIDKIYNCMTRLRIVFEHNIEISDLPLKQIELLNGVMGICTNNQELQIIVGPGNATRLSSLVAAILDERLSKKSSASKQESTKVNIDKFGTEVGEKIKADISQKNKTLFKLLLRNISDIFIPLIPAFIACGLITGLVNILLKIEPSYAHYPAVQILQICGNAVFFGLNIFVGVNTAKELKASPVLGGVMAIIITHPQLNNISLFDINLAAGRGGIFAVLFVVAFSSYLERYLRKIMPSMLDLFMTPLLVILISTFPALFILQPLGGVISSTIGSIVTQAIDGGGAITGFILAGTFLPLVMTGLHQGLTPIHADLLSHYGVTVLLPILAMAGAGQVGACLAVYLKTKNQRLKKTIVSALPVGIMGIGEPLIYGVTLPLGKPFIGACIGGAFGGAVQAYFHVGSAAMGLSGMPLTATTNMMLCYLIGLLTAYICGFLATYIIGFNDPVD